MSNFSKPFTDYKKNMLPEMYRDDNVEKFINCNAKRVVKIIYKDTSYGSGIVFKFGRKLCFQTNYHVVRKAHRDLVNIKIQIGGNDYKIDSYWGGCQKHDMALLTLKMGPKQFRHLDITDISQQVVDITVDGNVFKGLVEYHRGEHRFVVHALKFIQRRLDDDIEITCEFMDVKEPATCRMRDVCYCSKTGCAIIFLKSDNIPDGAKSMFAYQKLWENVQNPLVVVLSHPERDVKHISTGNVMRGECDENGFPQYTPADKVCFKIEGDNDMCRFDHSIGISNSPNDGTNYVFVNSKGDPVKVPTVQDVIPYFSCSGYDTKNSPVNRDDNRTYFYAREGQVYCCSKNVPTTKVLSGGDQFFKVEVNENSVLLKSWTDIKDNPITFPLLDGSRVGYLKKDTHSSHVLGFNVYSIQDKVYFQAKIEDGPDSVYFLVGRDWMVITRYNDRDTFVQTDMNKNKGYFKLDSGGNKMCVYEPERSRYLLEEDCDGTRVYFDVDEDGKKRYYTDKMQNFQKDQRGSRIFRRKEDQRVYYRNEKGKHDPFQIDSENNKMYLQIDYHNKQLYTMKDDNGDDKFVEIHKVTHLNHNAETAPGSSGGCVLVIGKDELNNYRCLVCMHKGKTENPPVNKAITYRLRE
ncbi:hypothetical protein SNE40_004017 [Patella caerulea]|uniref:Serine protease n=1 Tax=Patella caerulea TaxID=87958 RepID=A0AAN8K950_PATCE